MGSLKFYFLGSNYLIFTHLKGNKGEEVPCPSNVFQVIENCHQDHV